MGTRHLICVVKDGEYKVAQYGQWDGYPSGQGVDILGFLRDEMDVDAFSNGVLKCYQPTDEQIKNWWAEVGHDIDSSGGFVDLAIAKKFSKNHPSLSRDTGSDILGLIQKSKEPVPVRRYLEFAADSLFCEWAYVVDLDKRTFEVFEGFNHSPLSEGERFYGLQCKDVAAGYEPVKLKKSYSLDSLPSDSDFLSDVEPTDESDDE